MNSKEMKFQISDLLAEQLEMYADKTHVSIELAVEPILQWTMKEFEHQLTVIHSKFDQEQLEWFREHIDILDILSVSHPGELVHLLQFLWSDSSFEEEIDLSKLFDSLLTLTEQEFLILSWWVAKQ